MKDVFLDHMMHPLPVLYVRPLHFQFSMHTTYLFHSGMTHLQLIKYDSLACSVTVIAESVYSGAYLAQTSQLIVIIAGMLWQLDENVYREQSHGNLSTRFALLNSIHHIFHLLDQIELC